ncbi:hypothetical protein C4J95_2290 [Pseudomonas orientalis]|nr:hypothetical protein [Pseudomonas orientalis]AZE94311.1 hypothetical protein C4J96_2193 [Pseudomonas orientalis]AZE99752.1 hypothetical protein C4J95_2290 [Pseudomonas orientalis]
MQATRLTLISHAATAAQKQTRFEPLPHTELRFNAVWRLRLETHA